MLLQYFFIRYFEIKEGKREETRSAYCYVADSCSIDSLKTFVRNRVLKNPKALITIFSLMPLEKEKYLAMGGLIPAE